MDYAQLIEQFEITSIVALNLREAAESLARSANGTRSRIMSAHTAYALLGHLKLALGHLSEVAAFLPQGLRNSLDNPNVTITDRESLTGEPRDREESVNLARQALNQLSAALDATPPWATVPRSSTRDSTTRSKFPLPVSHPDWNPAGGAGHTVT